MHFYLKMKQGLDTANKALVSIWDNPVRLMVNVTTVIEAELYNIYQASLCQAKKNRKLK